MAAIHALQNAGSKSSREIQNLIAPERNAIRLAYALHPHNLATKALFPATLQSIFKLVIVAIVLIRRKKVAILNSSLNRDVKAGFVASSHQAGGVSVVGLHRRPLEPAYARMYMRCVVSEDFMQYLRSRFIKCVKCDDLSLRSNNAQVVLSW